MSDLVFKTEAEKYLAENHGNLNHYYGLIANGSDVGMAFTTALCQPDIYRIRQAGMWENLRGVQDPDSSAVISVIEFLKESVKDYPEDHPLWSLR